MFTFREAADNGLGYTVDEKGKRRLVDANANETGDEGDDNDDDEYTCMSSDGDEVLEYESDEEMADVLDEMNDEASASGSEESRSDEDDDDAYREFWYRAIVLDPEGRKTLEKDDERLPAWYRVAPPGITPLGGVLDDQLNRTTDEMFPLFYPTDREDASEHGSDSSYVRKLTGGPPPRAQTPGGPAPLVEPHPQTSADATPNSTDNEAPPSAPPKAKHPRTHEEGRDKNAHYRLGKLGYHPEDEYKVEHIAGPGCLNKDGYNGHNIATEEMRGCLTLQCLVRKPPVGAMLQYQPEPDDEDFERKGEFFLSGLSDYMPSRDSSNPRVYPARHGCSSPHAEGWFWREEDAEKYAMPFHPPCLEVYKRASRLRTGDVDIAGLTDWWTIGADYNTFYRLEQEVRDLNVRKCREQDWRHVNGTEYLAANPLLVPALPAILQQALVHDPDFDPRHGAFDVPDQTPSAPSNDPFAALPHELRMLVLSHISSPDIANLRLASRSFRQLPITLFHDLLLREMPWLWEVWCSTPYAFWATATAAEHKIAAEAPGNARQAMLDYTTIVQAEQPELTESMNEALAVYDEHATLENHHARHSGCATPSTLPRRQTNWYTLYTLITRHLHRGELKGLQNRRRIWRDCEEILRRIAKYREDGLAPVQDVKAVAREMIERQRAENRRWQEEATARRAAATAAAAAQD